MIEIYNLSLPIYVWMHLWLTMCKCVSVVILLYWLTDSHTALRDSFNMHLWQV